MRVALGQKSKYCPKASTAVPGCYRGAAQCLWRFVGFVGSPIPGGWVDQVSAEGLLTRFAPVTLNYSLAVARVVRVTIGGAGCVAHQRFRVLTRSGGRILNAIRRGQGRSVL